MCDGTRWVAIGYHHFADCDMFDLSHIDVFYEQIHITHAFLL